MTRDAADTVAKLLALAADNANENEARSAALNAARLFKTAGLELVDPDPSKATCVMCLPAVKQSWIGQCRRCGMTGDGPGHPCSNPEEGTLCKVHATWTMRAPTPKIDPFAGFFSVPRWPSRPPSREWVPPPVEDQAVIDGLREALKESRDELRASRDKETALREKLDELHDERQTLRELLHEATTGQKRLEPIDARFFVSVDDLDVSVRAAGCFERANVRYVGELVQLTEHQLLRIRNVGRRTVREIKEFLRMSDLPPLGSEIPDWEEHLRRREAAESARKGAA
jgi:hypothetical protein